MSYHDPIIPCEIPVIQKIIQDETWLEGERRNCRVLPGDPVVQENVCQVILRIGRELRETMMTQLVTGADSALPPFGIGDRKKAA